MPVSASPARIISSFGQSQPCQQLSEKMGSSALARKTLVSAASSPHIVASTVSTRCFAQALSAGNIVASVFFTWGRKPLHVQTPPANTVRAPMRACCVSMWS